MIAICPAGPPKLMKPSFSQKRSASANETTRRLGDGAAARAAGAGRAAEAMSGGHYGALAERGRVEIADVRRAPARVTRVELKHLVEVAVVEAPIPAHRQRVAAHEALDRRRVVGVHQRFHVALEVAGALQPVEE